MPGRPAKPLGLHIAQGTNRSRVKKREADKLHLKPGSIGECPSWIPPEGKEEWRRLTGDEDYSRCLAPSMRGTLIDYCNLYGRMIRAERRLPEWVDGKPAEPVDGEVVRERLSATEGNRLHSLRMQLGLTPASTSKVRAPESPKDDGWSDI